MSYFFLEVEDGLSYLLEVLDEVREKLIVDIREVVSFIILG